MKQIIEKAVLNKQKALSEYESKAVIAEIGIPVAKQGLAISRKEVLALAKDIGYPVVMKGCSDKLIHKTEMGMVKLDIKNETEASAAYDDLTLRGLEMDGVLVMEMISSGREFVIGLSRDPQFGPCVMFGLGGVYTEALNDVSFRVAPLSQFDAEDMIKEITAQKLLDQFRGSPPVDRKALSKILIKIGQLGLENDAIEEIDINPAILKDKELIAVDALIVLKQ